MAPLLEVRDLAVTYGSGAEAVRAVRGVSFALEPGETLGMAGESGCGKTTVALSLLRLLPATAQPERADPVQGRGHHRPGLAAAARGALGRGIGGLPGRDERAQPGADASASRSASRSCCTRTWPAGAAEARAADLLDSVGVPSARQASYPHELSGGQRQRVMIAMALACQPDLIIADEPTTALDVIVQAQILELLTGLVRERQISMIVISHDLSVLGETCDRLAIMYAGRMAETGPSREVLGAPRHPYTRILARAFPRMGDPASRLAPAGLPGEPPDLRGEITGCPFAPRCPEVIADCRTARHRALARRASAASRPASRCSTAMPPGPTGPPRPAGTGRSRPRQQRAGELRRPPRR